MTDLFVLTTALLIFAIPGASALPEPARSAVDTATFHCAPGATAETERREAQATSLTRGEPPYPLPNGIDTRPTENAARADALRTAAAQEEAFPAALCLFDSVAQGPPLPDLGQLAWETADPFLPDEEHCEVGWCEW